MFTGRNPVATEVASLKTKVKAILLSTVGACLALLVVACQTESVPSNARLEVPSGREPNASVSGSVTFREQLTLTPDARLIVELRDVSYADAPAPLIARQTILGPGQVPIKFKVEYSREDISSRNVYSVGARIMESDGRLAFINDTAHEVITGDNPSRVNMVLVLVEPPPDLLAEYEATGLDWRIWVEVPAQITWANLIPNEPVHLLRVAYYQSTIEGCARPGNQELQLDGFDIIARVTLMQPPPTPWAIPCQDEFVELDTVEAIGEPLQPGQTYRVIVNDLAISTFSLPEPDLGHTFITESPIKSAEVLVSEGATTQYMLQVTSSMPKGTDCSQFNGYEIRRREQSKIDVIITHHEIADASVTCHGNNLSMETTVPLGTDFELGVEYTVGINSDVTKSFVPR